jgi:hypothetical protein
MIHNTAFLNGINFNLLNRDSRNSKDVPGYGHVLKNNLGYKGRTEVSNIDTAACTLAANTFGMELDLSDRDFESLDQDELIAPRQPNGDLPDVPLMKLKAGSNAIDKGVDAGLPFSGKAPDLGAFESGGR